MNDCCFSRCHSVFIVFWTTFVLILRQDVSHAAGLETLLSDGGPPLGTIPVYLDEATVIPSLVTISNTTLTIPRNEATPDRGDLIIDHTTGDDPIVSFGYNIRGDMYSPVNSKEPGFGYMVEGNYDGTLEAYFTMRPLDPARSYVRPFMTRIDRTNGLPMTTYLAGGDFLQLGLIDGTGTDSERMTGIGKLGIRPSLVEAYVPLSVSGAITADNLTISTNTSTGSLILGVINDYDDGIKNDYSPPGFAEGTILSLLTDEWNLEITGLAGGSAGRILIIHNRTPENGNVIIRAEHQGSSAENRFAIAADITILPLSGALFYYNGTINRWLVIARL